jgi:hypothetical protein
MIDRVEHQRDLKPRRLVGDTAYGTAALLGWMVDEKRIEPHVSVWDKTTRKDNTFSRSEFIWNEQANEYRCPAGNALRSDWRPLKNPRTHITKADTIVYRASQMDCDGCSMKDRCCPNMQFRKIVRSIHEAARDEASASRQPRNTNSRAGSERRWKCSSLTSNASSNLIAYDCVVQAVLMMSF